MFDESQSYETTLDTGFWNIIRCSIWLFYAIWFVLIGVGISIVHCIDFCKICVKDARSTNKTQIATIVNSLQQQFELTPTTTTNTKKMNIIVTTNSMRNITKTAAANEQENKQAKETHVHTNVSSFHRCCPCKVYLPFFCFEVNVYFVCYIFFLFSFVSFFCLIVVVF